MDYVVDFRDVDRFYDLKPESLLQILGTVSTYDEVLGHHLRPGYMGQWNMAWILYQWKVALKEPKQYARVLRVTTLPIMDRGIYCYRHYLLEDERGCPVGRALSQWVAVDLEKRRLGKIPQEILTLFSDESPLSEREQFVLWPEDLRPLRRQQGNFQKELLIPVLYSDIDVNGHVNNAIYARWATETLHRSDEAFLRTHYPQAFTIVYKKEKTPQGRVRSRFFQDQDTTYHEILDESGQVLTILSMTWVPKAAHLGDYSDYDFSKVDPNARCISCKDR
ncbi:hypothetical protein ABB02_00900 [Clostridiaceae bacterium JG1575]|nr:hypothetical protein ABB02_00900 [Clostridiaceae bacterium JG1575]